MFGINYYFGYKCPLENRFKAIKNAGFSHVSLNADIISESIYGGIENMIILAKKCGLEISYIHGPYCKEHSIRYLFEDSAKTREIIEFHKYVIKICGKYGISSYVLHANRNHDNPVLNEICIKNFKEINDFAKQNNVKIAIENTTSKEVLDFLFREINDINFGFCYDTGHNNVYTKDPDILDNVKNKVYVVHLHDNYGEFDNHNQIGNGNINWNNIYDALDDANFKGIMSLEVKASQLQKTEISMEEFLKESYKKLENSLNEYKKQKSENKEKLYEL